MIDIRIRIGNKIYRDHTKTLKLLRQDSGLVSPPRENWNTFEPVKGDLAIADRKEYVFDGTDWVETGEELPHYVD